jgi:hypothetical protein
MIPYQEFRMKNTLDDYSGDFDPDFDLSRLTKNALARLGREYMFFSHLHDRAIMMIIFCRYGSEAQTNVAVDEWMGASPIYSERLRKFLKIEGNGVAAVLKTLQVDVGAPHQYLDFGYELVDDTLGYFWAKYCGPYECVKTATGGHEGSIKQICHDMEDTTMPATTMSLNPKINNLPVFRPPLPPDHTGPVCKWEVSLKDEHEIIENTEICKNIEQSKAAKFEFSHLKAEPGNGMYDYSGPFKPDFELEDLSHHTLVGLCKEFMMELHLLIRACMISITQRWGEASMLEIAREEWLSIAPIYVERIRKALGMEGNDMGAILKMIQVDPSFPHEYVDFGCKRVDENLGYFWINKCDAISEGEAHGWLTLLKESKSPGFEALIEAVNPRAKCFPTDPKQLENDDHDPVYAWEIVISDAHEPRDRSGIPEPALADELRSVVFKPRGDD